MIEKTFISTVEKPVLDLEVILCLPDCRESSDIKAINSYAPYLNVIADRHILKPELFLQPCPKRKPFAIFVLYLDVSSFICQASKYGRRAVSTKK